MTPFLSAEDIDINKYRVLLVYFEILCFELCLVDMHLGKEALESGLSAGEV